MSMGVSFSTSCPPCNFSPVQKSNQAAPLGKYSFCFLMVLRSTAVWPLLLLVYMESVMGHTSRDLPNIYSLSMFHTFLSAGKSITRARIIVPAREVTCQALE